MAASAPGATGGVRKSSCVIVSLPPIPYIRKQLCAYMARVPTASVRDRAGPVPLPHRVVLCVVARCSMSIALEILSGGSALPRASFPGRLGLAARRWCGGDRGGPIFGHRRGAGRSLRGLMTSPLGRIQAMAAPTVSDTPPVSPAADPRGPARHDRDRGLGQQRGSEQRQPAFHALSGQARLVFLVQRQPEKVPVVDRLRGAEIVA